MGAVTILDHNSVTVSNIRCTLSPDGNLLELNEIGTGAQQPHDFDWSED